MIHSVCRETVCTVSCYTVSAERLYVLCHVIQCLQRNCMCCVLLYSVCRQTICTVSCNTVSADRQYVLCHVIQCLQGDCMCCVMLYSVCRETICAVSWYTVSAERLYVLCHVTQCLQTDRTTPYQYLYEHLYQCHIVTSVYMWNKFYIVMCSAWFALATSKIHGLWINYILF